MRTKKLLLIFTRTPEFGKVKTRLAKDIGAEKALEVYKVLLNHTRSITEHLEMDKWLYYSEAIPKSDAWNQEIYKKKKQIGADLGERMLAAFQGGFDAGYEHIAIIGSDMLDLQQQHIENAFEKLKETDTVIGPAQDGGYYLLGLKQPIPILFQNKQWGENNVFKATVKDLDEDYSSSFLEILNDIDVISDIKSDSSLHKLIQ